MKEASVQISNYPLLPNLAISGHVILNKQQDDQGSRQAES